MLQRLDYIIQAIGRIEGRQESFKHAIYTQQHDLKDHSKRIQRLEHHLATFLALASPKMWWTILLVGVALFAGPETLATLERVKTLIQK